LQFITAGHKAAKNPCISEGYEADDFKFKRKPIVSAHHPGMIAREWIYTYIVF
jgi:hypothetical protein